MAIKITSDIKSTRPKPSKWKELKDIIKAELERQGPDADLNFIDTSLITSIVQYVLWSKYQKH